MDVKYGDAEEFGHLIQKCKTLSFDLHFSRAKKWKEER